jgi:DNA-binding CsgD family transcriptional regulator
MMLIWQGRWRGCWAGMATPLAPSPVLERCWPRWTIPATRCHLPAWSAISNSAIAMALLAQTLRAQHPTMALVFMTAWPTTADAVDAVRRHGGLDYLEKPLDEGRLLAAVAEGLAWATGQQRRQAVLAALTRRERAVFDLLVRGHGNKDIADRLGISVRTVEDHRAAVMAKTGAAGLAGLMSLVGQSQEGGCSASAPMAQKRC